MSDRRREGREDSATQFRLRLQSVVSGWQRQLQASPSREDAARIAEAAGRQRDLARSHGCLAIAETLATLAKTSPTDADSIAKAVVNVAQAVQNDAAAGGPEPSGKQSSGVANRRTGGPTPPPPPLLNSSSAGPAPALASRRGTPQESSSGARLVSPPKRLVNTIMGFRAFGRKASAVEAPPMGGHERSLLGFTTLNSEPAPRDPVRLRRAPRFPRAEAAGGKHATSSAPTPLVDRPPPPRWFYVMTGAMAVLGSSVVAMVLSQHGGPASTSAAATAAAVSAASASASSGEIATLAMHDQGRTSPELRALIEAQIRLMSDCRTEPGKCGGWTPFSHAALTPATDGGTVARAPARVGPHNLPAWLQRLQVPEDFPVRDEPALKSVFEYRARNIAGRAQFQRLYFNCSAYEDIVDGALVRYGAPRWLKAVVYQESGCDPVAVSSAGAKGLWQFMPEAARAYGLRVLEDDVDERLDVVKATDAAVHFLTDLRQELGAWDLALAAYNVGPFGVSARLMQVGGNATFWDLTAAGLLPQETAGYVPAIEAYALILQNLRPLNLGGGGKHPQTTAEIVVKPGTRLSLIARAAHTSTVHIRELNRAYLRDVVPDGETTAWVPDSEVHRAQVFLESMSAADDDRVDACVPEDFDWGTTVLETSKFAKRCARPRGAY
jgi:hypothetical protein